MEKERMKRVVLNIHERQEEEDYQGMIVCLCACIHRLYAVCVDCA